MKKSLILFLFLIILSLSTNFAAHASEEKTIIIDNCDIGIGSNAQFVDQYNNIEGSGCYVTNYWGLINSYQPVDLSSVAKSNAYLEFYFYIDDLNLLSSVFVNINSSGKTYWDSNIVNDERHCYNEYFWDISGITYRRGWNYVSIKLSDAISNYGVPNYEKIIQFKMVFYRPQSMYDAGLTSYIKVDQISITNTPKTIPSEVLEAADVDKRHTVPQKIKEDITKMYSSNEGCGMNAFDFMPTMLILIFFAVMASRKGRTENEK